MEPTEDKAQPLSRGEREVAITETLGKNPRLHEVKAHLAQVINILTDFSTGKSEHEKFLIEMAIRKVKTANKRAVRAMTYEPQGREEKGETGPTE